MSTYTLTATEYSEIVLFSIRTDQVGGKDIVYDLSGQTRSVPVTVEGGRIQFKSPFTLRSFVFEGNKWGAEHDSCKILADRFPALLEPVKMPEWSGYTWQSGIKHAHVVR